MKSTPNIDKPKKTPKNQTLLSLKKQTAAKDKAGKTLLPEVSPQARDLKDFSKYHLKESDHQHLLAWYDQNKRELPWRKNRDPYLIWISEVMCQQTTITAVLPFFNRFKERYPTVQDLAQSTIEELYTYWAGLGYYSRARSLLSTAQVLAKTGFPKTAAGWLELKGVGPYTSRAVTSIAFDEPVGVLDGNVIRVLCRRLGLEIPWWQTHEKRLLQEVSDSLAKMGRSGDLNQALMELGATICTPQKTTCWLCPWSQDCKARLANQVQNLPLKKPKTDTVILNWHVDLQTKTLNGQTFFAAVTNDYLPFLKGQLVFPGNVTAVKAKPKTFDMQHSITKYAIYVHIQNCKPSDTDKTLQNQRPETAKKISDSPSDIQWLTEQQLTEKNPSSLLTKVIRAAAALTS